MPTYSVIIPCYNTATFVGAAIRSCLAQTVHDLEVIVVDDGSTDDSATVIQDVAAEDSRVRVIRQANRGLGAARNAGLAVARGAFVNFLDADDLFDPEKLAVQGAVLAERADIGMVLCDGVAIDHAGTIVWNTLVDWRRLEGHPPIFHVLFRGGLFQPLIPLIRRELATAVGGFDEDRVAAGVADTGFWMRLGLAGADYHIVRRHLVRYRTHETNMSHDTEHMERAALSIYSKVMADRPYESAVALRAAHQHIRMLETSAYDARTFAATREPMLRASRASAWRAVLGLLGRVSQDPASPPVVIWGAGAAGRGVLQLLRKAGCTVEAFIDSNPLKAGTEVDGVPVVEPSVLRAPRAPRPYILVASLHAAAIEQQLAELGRRPGLDYYVADFDATDLEASAPSSTMDVVLAG